MVITKRDESIVCKAPPPVKSKQEKRSMLKGKTRARQGARVYNLTTSSNWVSQWAAKGI